MKDFRISTMVTNIKDFNPCIFEKNGIGMEIQCFPQHILDDNNEELIRKFQEKLKDFNGTVSLHGSSFDLCPGSTDKKILEITKYRYLQSIEIAESLGASYVVFHSQLNPLLTVEKIRHMKINNQIEFWNDLLEELQDKNITILLENEYDHNYEELLYMIESINSEKVKVCLDIGHALAYSKLNLKDWISGLDSHIKYIHLHWNDRENDSHDMPSNEQLELLRKILIANNINPIITLEYRAENIVKEVDRVKSIFEKSVE